MTCDDFRAPTGLLGMAMGWQGWPVVLAGTLLAWAAAAAMLIGSRAAGHPRGSMPMGPFLLGGAVLALALG